MPVKKDYLTIQLHSGKLKVCIAIFVILGCAFLIRLTPLINNYLVNFISALIVSNGISLSIIAFLLLALHIVDLKRFKEILKKEDEKNVH